MSCSPYSIASNVCPNFALLKLSLPNFPASYLSLCCNKVHPVH